MVQVDGAESGGPVDPGVACWVGMSGEPEAREERGLSPWQFAVRGATWSSAELGLRSKAFDPVQSGAILYTLTETRETRERARARARRACFPIPARAL